MATMSFEEVWRKLRTLENEVVLTPSTKEPNLIVSFGPSRMQRKHLREGADKTHPKEADWIDGTTIARRFFVRWWDRLQKRGIAERQEGDSRIAAACLAKVQDLGVTITKTRNPLTLSLQRIPEPQTLFDDDTDNPGNLERIVVDPEICSGKPTIRGTRIMVGNILGMFAGDYTMDRILRAYPELSFLDVTSALEYASLVVDREKIIASG